MSKLKGHSSDFDIGGHFIFLQSNLRNKSYFGKKMTFKYKKGEKVENNIVTPMKVMPRREA